MKTSTKIKLASLSYWGLKGARQIFGLGDRATVVRNGFKWDLDLAEGIDLSIYLFGQFENETASALNGLIKPESTVFDIGANIGAHTLNLARLVGPTGVVYAFEPTAYAFGKLTRNLELNPEIRKRVVTKQARLARDCSSAAPAEIYSSWKVVGQDARHPKHLGIAKSTEGAAVISLDEYCGQAEVSRIDFIKLDVDGFECEVLSGAIQRLQRDRPMILLELAPYVLAERGASVEELWQILAQCGYRLENVDDRSAILDPLGFSKGIADGAGINVLAAPI
jgi:FkbM family methyltransferase